MMASDALNLIHYEGGSSDCSFILDGCRCMVIGCMQPAFTSATGNDQVLSKTNSVKRAHTTLMQDMDCCHHESPSGPANGDKRSPHDSVSCCPIDARVSPTQKLNPAPSASSFESDAIPSVELLFAFTRYGQPLAFAQAFWHSGRDTLLKTRVLRI